MKTLKPGATLLTRLDAILASSVPTGAKSAADVSVAPGKRKGAEAESEPDVTNMDGSTESPSKSVDDATQPNDEGSHAKTNDKDVEEVGVEPLDKTAMDNLTNKLNKLAADSGGMDHTKVHNSIRLTGEDPKNELSGVKDNTKKDPGSTTPMRTDNNELDGKKYASMDLKELYPAFNKSAVDLMNLLGEVADEQADAPATPKTAADVAVSGSTQVAAVAGSAKVASDEDCTDTLHAFISMGSHRADLVGPFIHQKQAADQARAQLSQKRVTPSRKRAEDMPPPEGAGGPPMDPAAMGGGGGDVPPPGPEAAAGGDAGGGAPADMSLEQIIAELQAAGVPEEEIQKLLAESGAGGGGGPGGPPPGPDAGGAPAGPPPEAPPGGEPKVASDRKPLPKPRGKVNVKVAVDLIHELVRRSQY